MENLLTETQKDNIGTAYLRNILGVNEESINNFVEDRPVLHKDICAKMSGMLLDGVAPAKYDEAGFWRECQPVLGKDYEKIETQFRVFAAKMGPYKLLSAANPQGNKLGVIGRIIHFHEVYDYRLDGSQGPYKN